MAADFDVAVIGSGFAGSLMAMIAKRLGRSVILLERGKHPRFAIGESSTPLANLLLEELSSQYDLKRLLPLTRWGSWQRAYPNIACGLKRGFTFFHHRFGEPFSNNPGRGDQLLVAASPRDEIADMHWYRPDFDHFLVDEARALGVEYVDEAGLSSVAFAGDRATLSGERNGQRLDVCVRFIIDATGPRGFLHRALGFREVPFEVLPATQALFTHFTDVRRWDEMFLNGEVPPYPVDDAAMHHVFDGGWIWVLRFNNGIASAGVAATDRLADELRFTERASAWDRLLRRLPTVRKQFADAVAQYPFVHTPRLSFRSQSVAGSRWALVPSAAGFVDPLLSTGFPLALMGVVRLARVLEKDLDSPRLEGALKSYARQTREELDITANLVAALYASMKDFDLFAALSLLYFTAASFSETARRLGRPHLAPGFLLAEHSGFGPGLRQYCGRVLSASANGGLTGKARTELIMEIREAIEPFDVAGLSRRDRRNWYPVLSEDLLRAAPKLSAGEAEIRELLARQRIIL